MITIISLDEKSQCSIQVNERELSPSKSSWFTISITAKSEGFSGNALIYLSESSLDNFCKELMDLDRELKGRASVPSQISSDDNPVPLIIGELILFNYDLAGHLGLRVKLSRECAGRFAGRNSTDIEFEISPDQVTLLRNKLERLLTENTGI